MSKDQCCALSSSNLVSWSHCFLFLFFASLIVMSATSGYNSNNSKEPDWATAEHVDSTKETDPIGVPRNIEPSRFTGTTMPEA